LGEDRKRNGALAALNIIPSVDKKALKIFGWMDWVVTANLPFDFVRQPVNRKYAKLQKISVNTLKKYMNAVMEIVERKISEKLPQYFGIIIDGWTEAGTHFVAIFASFIAENGNLCQPLLACSPMGDETSQAANAFIIFLEDMLEIYQREIDNVVFLVSDNTGLNPSIARKIDVPFVGCMSHRLNLAVEAFMNDSNLTQLVDKVHQTMVKLSSAKMRAYLRKKGCSLMPMKKNDTRWSSIFSMLQRYFHQSFATALRAIAQDRSCFQSNDVYWDFQNNMLTAF
jgi:hypothetical protein